MLCGQCGQEIPESATRCPGCGRETAGRELPSTVPAQRAPIAPETKIIAGRFVVVKVVGRGGMGMVYQGFDRRLERTVAIKRLVPELSGQSQAAQRFEIEAKSVAALNHPNVVSIYDIGHDAEGKYIVMEFVDGESLANKLRREGKMNVNDAIHLFLQIGRALQSMHEQGVIHRDIKPGNVLITAKGVPKLADFGLAQLARLHGVTQTGMAMGTLGYASPEQMSDAKRVDHRSDIYACGAMLYEMFTGDSPRIIQEGAISPNLRPILMKCLAKAPEHRYQSVRELLGALSDVYRKTVSGPQKAVPAPPPPSAKSTPRPSPAPVAATVEHVVWRERRRPWSQPGRMIVGAALFFYAALYGDIINQKAWGALYTWQRSMRDAQPSNVTSASSGMDGFFDYLTTIPYGRVALLIGLFCLLWPLWRCAGTEYRLTPTHLVVRRGFFLRRETDVPLASISEVQLHTGLFGALLGYGRLHISRINKMPVSMEGVPRPQAAKDAITSQLSRNR